MSLSRLQLPPTEDLHHHNKGKDSIATFISKVWRIVEKAEYNNYIHWSETGKTFVVCDYPNFAREVLPHYFKHSNFSSFVRQLNLYGFRKVSHPEQGVLASKAQSDEPLEFWHANFRRGHPELLHLVQRKTHSSHVSSVKTEAKSTQGHRTETGGEEFKPVMTKVMGDIHLMQGRQENIMLVLDALKQDNVHLHRELKQLREKSARQQKVLNKIIQFLVHMVYKGKLPTKRSANNQLMLMEPNSIEGPPSPKRMRPAVMSELDTLIDFDDDPTTDLMLNLPPSVSVLSPDSFEQISTPPTVEPSQPLNTPASVPDMSTSTTLPSNTPLVLPADTILTALSSPNTSSPTFTSHSLMSAPTITSYTSPTKPTPSTTQTGLIRPHTDLKLDGDQLALVPLEGDGLNMDNKFQLPVISKDLLSEYPIHPAPSSLMSTPHPDNPLCINGHLNHQQNGIDALPDMLSGQLSLDPTLISEYLSSEQPTPNYDFVDTARLLESLTNMHDDTITDESTLYQQLQHGQVLPLTAPSQAQQITATSDDASDLEKLLQES